MQDQCRGELVGSWTQRDEWIAGDGHNLYGGPVGHPLVVGPSSARVPEGAGRGPSNPLWAAGAPLPQRVECYPLSRRLPRLASQALDQTRERLDDYPDSPERAGCRPLRVLSNQADRGRRPGGPPSPGGSRQSRYRTRALTMAGIAMSLEGSGGRHGQRLRRPRWTPARSPPQRRSAPGPAVRLSSRRSLIKQVYEVDPVVCPRCAGTMQIIAII